MPEYIDVYCSAAPFIKAEGCEPLLFDFIQKRLAHFFSDFSLRFFIQEADSNIPIKDLDPEQLIIITPLAHPLLDAALLRRMIEAARLKGAPITARGAVPGTAPTIVCRAGLFNTPSSYAVHSDLQRRYNSQFNLGRTRRLKLFRSLLKKLDLLHTLPVEAILDFFGSKEGTAFVVGYGEEVALEYLDRCPLCHSCSFSPVFADVSQPLTGFLTRFSEYYFLCHDCGLVFANPHMPEAELWRYYDQYSYESGWTPETLQAHYVHLDHLNTSHFLNYVAVLPYLKKLPAQAVAADLGGGNGEFAVFLRQHFPDFTITLWDYHVSQLIQEGLLPWNIKTKQSNFLNAPLDKEHLDVITNWEVIEHLPIEKLESYFKTIYDSLKKGGLYLFSTPDFDNPYCHALDFWAITPGEHLSVLSRRVLEPLLTRCGFTIIGEHHECVSLKTADRWYKYGAECNAFETSRAEAMIINDFLKEGPMLSHHLDWLRRNNLGSELILCCQKKE